MYRDMFGFVCFFELTTITICCVELLFAQFFLLGWITGRVSVWYANVLRSQRCWLFYAALVW